MAERRMFAKSIIDSDAFLDMPDSAQLLYFHLGMRADDDGFVNQPKSIMRQCGAKDDDIRLLFAKKFVIPFESGVVVIKHWRIHNYIRKDTYTPTKYVDEKDSLRIDRNGAYTMSDLPSGRITAGASCDEPVTDPSRIRDDPLTQDRIGKVRTGKDNPPISPLGDQSESLDVETASGAGTPADHSTTSDRFEEFWAAYPRKTGKGAARKAWGKLKPGNKLFSKIMSAVEAQRQSDQWQRDHGQFIPYPATWLNQERWEDSPNVDPPPGKIRSYDIGELEEMSHFDLPEELRQPPDNEDG